MATSRSGDTMASRIVRIISAFDGTHPAMPISALVRRTKAHPAVSAPGSGYASLPGTVVADTTGIAEPFFGATGQADAALGVVVPTGAENLAATVPALMAAARGISRGLGVTVDQAGPHHHD